METEWIAVEMPWWALGLLLAALLAAVYRFREWLVRRMPLLGAPAKVEPAALAAIEVKDSTGEAWVIGRAGKAPTLLVFVSAGCAKSFRLAVELPAVVASLGGRARMLLVLERIPAWAKQEECVEQLVGQGPLRLALAPRLFVTYAVSATPYAVLVGAEGTVEWAGPVSSAKELPGV